MGPLRPTPTHRVVLVDTWPDDDRSVESMEAALFGSRMSGNYSHHTIGTTRQRQRNRYFSKMHASSVQTVLIVNTNYSTPLNSH